MRIFYPLFCRLLAIGWLIAVPSAARAAETADPVRGLVRAEATATISSELVAQIKKLPFKVGQLFRMGDILVAFDCRRYQADLRAAAAEVHVNKITADQNRELLRLRAGGANDLAIAEAKLAQAQAGMDSLKVRLSQCIIRAPFDGRVSERLADVFERPRANAPLLKIVKTGNLELDLIIPSNWATWLRSGQQFSFRIDETKTVHTAEVLYLGAVVDPISRTVRVSARLINPVANVRPGMSGSAEFPLPSN